MADYRHELKYQINASYVMAIRRRLQILSKPDPHARDGRYLVRSLYFDNLEDKALREKVDGVNRRVKFRIRCYNGDFSFIHLEKKCKWGALTRKESIPVSEETVQAILQGRKPDGGISPKGLLGELCRKMDTEGLRPKTIVDYVREPFVYGPGNVRVTLDYDIRTGICGTDFLNPDCVMVPSGEPPVILEVKWDAFLPDIIRDAVQLPGRMAGAYSKYAACRIYG